MKIKNYPDFFSGVMFVIVGVAFAIGAVNYNIGVAAHMGPGYFPLLLGTILSIIGCIIMIKSVITNVSAEVGSIAWKPLIFIIAANVAFGLSIIGGGLLIAAVLMITVVLLPTLKRAFKNK